MDETVSNQGGADAWFLSRLGQAIDVYVDRQINSPQVIQSSAAYGVDPNTGALYHLGQPGVVQTVAPVQGGSNMGLLVVLGLLLVVTHHG
ncbi:hypothetical protein HAV22_21355 [Massilia sp. TW-1]|uniref:Uncharacterized protein n=1 Tax=Telluria antibiotica TaxID=2717319 RepID=A0ABX0PIC2_9BURK|nr:hypothetical protein [Telluria antibiotica]NIA56184.1 hypothetical protein [Telluria antibiotica]